MVVVVTSPRGVSGAMYVKEIFLIWLRLSASSWPQVTRGGAGKIFSPDGMIAGAGITRLSPWEKTENKTAKAAASPATTVTGGGGTSGEGSSTASLSAAEKSAILKRMIMVILFSRLNCCDAI